MTVLSESGFRVFNPQRFGFPHPKVPILPRRLRTSWGQSNGAEFIPITEGRAYRFYNWGRYALGEALRLSGVGPGGAFLAPAYHCRTMLDPALALNGDITLYPVSAELVPDIKAIEKLICSSKTPVRALLATHYFGFPQEMDVLKTLCLEHRVTLIEDCSHAFLCRRNERNLGMQGRFIIASPYKFYPSIDGGILIGDIDNGRPELRRRALLEEVSASRRFVEGIRARRFDHKESRPPLQLMEESPDDDIWVPGDSLSSAYDRRQENRRGLAISKWVIQHGSAESISLRRRVNYLKWLEAVSGLSGCRALYPTLPDAVVPYMFPLYLETPFQHFHLLKSLGMPIWRWDSMGASDCDVAMDYRLHLLHLPCHQDLDIEEMEWMIATLSRVLCHKGGSDGF